MGHFYRGEHYSTRSNLGPNERIGIEDDMPFYNFANQLDTSKNETNNSDDKKQEKQYSKEELLEIIKSQNEEIFTLKQENKRLLDDKTSLSERNKNLLSLMSQNEDILKKEKEKIIKLKSKLEQNSKNATNLEQIDLNITGGSNGKFTDGVFIEPFEGQYGQILKFSINLKKFVQNNRVSPKGYVYFEAKKSQSGRFYAAPQKFFNG